MQCSGPNAVEVESTFASLLVVLLCTGLSRDREAGMASQHDLEKSHKERDIVNWRWGYVLVVCKTAIMVLDAGLPKSFGVLIPEMVVRLDQNYASVGLICSLPGTLVYICCPLVSSVLERANRRIVALVGGATCAISLGLCAILTHVAAVGLCLALTGIGIACVYMALMLSLNDFFPERFVLMNTISLYGYTAGTMILPYIVERSLESYGYSGAFLIMAAISLNAIACAVAIRKPILKGFCKEKIYGGRLSEAHVPENLPLMKNEDNNHNKFNKSRTFEDVKGRNYSWWTVFSEEPFLICSLSLPFLFAYLLYSWMLFLVPHAQQLGIPERRGVLLSSIAGIAGIFGRTLFVVLAAKKVGVFYIYTVAGLINTVSFLLDSIGSDFSTRSALAFLQGFNFFAADSMFFTIPKVTVVDQGNFSRALALVSFAYGFGASLAGYVTGHLVDIIHSYTKIFIILGILHALVVIQCIITAIYLRKRDSKPK